MVVRYHLLILVSFLAPLVLFLFVLLALASLLTRLMLLHVLVYVDDIGGHHVLGHHGVLEVTLGPRRQQTRLVVMPVSSNLDSHAQVRARSSLLSSLVLIYRKIERL